MVVSPEMDKYMLESIQHSLGLDVSDSTLKLKVLSLEESQKRLQAEIFTLHDQLKDKERKIDLARAEASINARSLKKFIEENNRLTSDMKNLKNQCSKWKNECFLYDQDRNVLMEFANETDERAKTSEARVQDIEQESRAILKELESYKMESSKQTDHASRLNHELLSLKQRIKDMENERSRECFSENERLDSLADAHNESSEISSMTERNLLDLMVTEILEELPRDQVKDSGTSDSLTWAFLEAHKSMDSCHRFLDMWESLKPSTKNVITMVAACYLLQNDKISLTFNLLRAEEEAKVLFEENNILDEKNQKLMRKLKRERQQESNGNLSPNVPFNVKRRSNPSTNGIIQKEIGCSKSPGSSRKPLSPLQLTSL